jgi:hypothetical protein
MFLVIRSEHPILHYHIISSYYRYCHLIGILRWLYKLSPYWLRTKLIFPVGRSLHMHIPDYGRGEGANNYSVVMDFAYWLTRTRCILIHGGFDSKGREENTRTWDLIRRFVAKCKDIEHMQLSREGWGLHLVQILKWINFPKLKKLDIHGISEWKHGIVELELEVCTLVSVELLKKSSSRGRPIKILSLLNYRNTAPLPLHPSAYLTTRNDRKLHISFFSGPLHLLTSSLAASTITPISWITRCSNPG